MDKGYDDKWSFGASKTSALGTADPSRWVVRGFTGFGRRDNIVERGLHTIMFARGSNKTVVK